MRQCDHCSIMAQPGDNYCAMCGASLAFPPSPEPEPWETLARWDHQQWNGDTEWLNTATRDNWIEKVKGVIEAAEELGIVTINNV